MDITLTQALSALAIIAAAIAVIVRAMKPWNETQERIRTLEDNQKDMAAAIADIREGDKVSNTLLLQMATHMIDGNHVEKLTSARDSMQQYLIERG